MLTKAVVSPYTRAPLPRREHQPSLPAVGEHEPVKRIAAKLAGRGIDFSDRESADDAVRALTAENLARRLAGE